ncbi:MAG TPA: hypothetical protein VLZ83_06445 [Edaphocola sp.]|nr:hypothetical protein [Edaphocola sp.]
MYFCFVKRIIAIFLMLIYTVSVSGAVVQLHFCGDELESISLNNTNKSKCCCKVDNTIKQDPSAYHFSKQSCCNESTITLKLDLDQTLINSLSQLQLFQTTAAIPSIILPIWHNNFSLKADKITYFSNAPPLGIWQNIPLYKLNNSFVLYDDKFVSI